MGILGIALAAALSVPVSAGETNPTRTYSAYYMDYCLTVAGPEPECDDVSSPESNIGDFDQRLNDSATGSGEFGAGDSVSANNRSRVSTQDGTAGLASVQVRATTSGSATEGGGSLAGVTPTADGDAFTEFGVDVSGEVGYSIGATASATQDGSGGSCAHATLARESSEILYRKAARSASESSPCDGALDLQDQGAASGTLSEGQYDVDVQARGQTIAEAAGRRSYSANAEINISFEACSVAKEDGILRVIGPTKRGGSCVEQCFGRQLTMPNAGTTGNDTIEGTPQRDVIDGGEGEDTIRGKGGRDLICGSSENDRINGGPDNDRVDGGSGDDKVNGADGDDPKILGQSGEDVLEGEEGEDTIDGGAGGDTIAGGRVLSGGPDPTFSTDNTGQDTLDGGGGGDSIGGGDKKDTIRGGAQDLLTDLNDLNGQGGPDVITMGTGYGIIDGGDGDDTLNGGIFEADSIHGDAGEDTIDGHGGDDTLRGGAESDDIFGGDGADHMDGQGGGGDVCDGEEPEPDPGPPPQGDRAVRCETVFGASTAPSL